MESARKMLFIDVVTMVDTVGFSSERKQKKKKKKTEKFESSVLPTLVKVGRFLFLRKF